jgi:hypothetical protein
MTKTIITFLCLLVVFAISTAHAFCSDAENVYSSSESAEVVPPLQNNAVDQQVSRVPEEKLQEPQAGSFEKSDIRKFTPPSLPHKIARIGLISPVKWIAGMPVVVTNVAYNETKYGINGQALDKADEGSGHNRHRRLCNIVHHIARMPVGLIDGLSVAPVFAGEHAWDDRPLSQLAL